MKQKGSTAWVDGQNLLGAVVGNFCVDLAIKLAKEHGVGWVVAKNSNHFGIAGYWSLQAAAQGLVVKKYSPLKIANKGVHFRDCLVRMLRQLFSQLDLQKFRWVPTRLASLLQARMGTVLHSIWPLQLWL